MTPLGPATLGYAGTKPLIQPEPLQERLASSWAPPILAVYFAIVPIDEDHIFLHLDAQSTEITARRVADHRVLLLTKIIVS